MDHDDELAHVRDTWQGSTSPVPSTRQTREHIRATTLRHRLLLSLEIIVSLAIPVVALDALQHHPEVVTRSISAALVIHIAAVWAIVFWNQRARRAALSLSSRQYLAATVTLCRRQLWSIAMLAALTLLEISVVFWFLGRIVPPTDLLAHSSAAYSVGERAVGLLATTLLASGLAWSAIVARREQRVAARRIEVMDADAV